MAELHMAELRWRACADRPGRPEAVPRAHRADDGVQTTFWDVHAVPPDASVLSWLTTISQAATTEPK